LFAEKRLIMAKAYKCDLCGKLVESAANIGGVDFKIGERRDEFTGTHAEMKEVKEICIPCHQKIMETVKSIYEESNLITTK